jgi:hypothetical protein
MLGFFLRPLSADNARGTSVVTASLLLEGLGGGGGMPDEKDVIEESLSFDDKFVVVVVEVSWMFVQGIVGMIVPPNVDDIKVDMDLISFLSLLSLLSLMFLDELGVCDDISD